MKNPLRGFSLIELLVVIAVIGVLASLVVVGGSALKQRSRDARRYADIGQLAVALEVYYNVTGNYPSTAGVWQTVCTNGLNHTAFDITGGNGYIPNLAPGYIPALPVDPSGCGGGGQYKGYVYRSDGTNYKVIAEGGMEVGAECVPGKAYDDPARDQTSCAIFSPGASAW